MKSPAFSFYVRDWLCSKTVSKLHSKALANGELNGSNLFSRGLNAYVFLLCEAWLEDPIATLPDDDAELAVLARVTPEEWTVIKPVIMTAFQQDASGRLFNERQMHEAKKQQTRKQNGSKGGSKKVANRLAALENEIEIENDTTKSTLKDKSKAKGSVDEIRAFCLEIGLTEPDADWFFNKCEGCGWSNNGNPIKDWKATIRAWQQKGNIFPGQAASGSVKPLPLWLQIKGLEERIARHKANRESVHFDRNCTQEQLDDLNALCRQLDKMKGISDE